MEEIRGEGCQQLSNLLYLSNKQVGQLSKEISQVNKVFIHPNKWDIKS